MKARNAALFLAIMGALASCDPGGESGSVEVPAQVYVPLDNQGSQAGRVDFEIVIDNRTNSTVQLKEVALSCSCLQSSIQLPIVVPARSQHPLPLSIEHDPLMVRRGGVVVLRFDRDVTAQTQVTLVAGSSVEVAPSSATLLAEVSSRASMTQRMEIYSPEADKLVVSGRLAKGPWSDYKLEIRTVKQLKAFRVCELTHSFNVGPAGGSTDGAIELFLGGAVVKTVMVRAVVRSPDYIPPVIVSNSGAAAFEAALQVPWMLSDNIKRIEIANEVPALGHQLDAGMLKVTLPAAVLPKSFGIVSGAIHLADGRVCSFSVVRP